jgi:hypothetical protein
MSEEQEPKIIVDDDWKEQVAKEKEAMAAKASGDKSTAQETPSDADESATSESVTSEPVTDQPATGGPRSPEMMPPASFEVLVSMMFTQGMSMLGHIPHPETGEATVNKPFAKHTIDTLEVLTEKTKGNLTDNEAKMLSEAMHALRMAYVSAK